MTHSILDASPIDRDIDGHDDIIYAGDLGGNILALRDKEQTGVWEKHRLFDLPATLMVAGQTIKLGQKFMYAPEVGAAAFGEMLYIGTGDRKDPTDTDFVNAIYAIPSTWVNTGVGTEPQYKTLTPADLVDVTDNRIQLGSEEEKSEIRAALAEKKGWFIRLRPGEKVVSSPLLHNKVLYFTTYTPGTDTESSSDPCTSNVDMGDARLYAIDYMTGEWRFPDGRDKEVGTGIPSPPSIIEAPGGPKLLGIAQGGGGGGGGGGPNAFGEDLSDGDDARLKQFFWRQIR